MHEPIHHSSQALNRFAVISQVLADKGSGEKLADTVRLVASRKHVFFDGSPRRVSERSIYRWLAAYEALGVTGLEPKRRSGSQCSKGLPPDFMKFVIDQKRRDVSASIPELIRRAVQRGVLKRGNSIDRSTVYRTLKRLGTPVARCKQAKDRDTRRFAFAHRMDMVLCDGKHFRAGGQRHKRVALFYLDDATRYVLHTVVGTSETAYLFQRGLYQCIAKYGMMSAVYLDHGSGFIAQDTVCVLANLGIPLIHGQVGYKQGRGKIERFNRTVTADVIRGLDARPDVDSTCSALELRLGHYTDKLYAQRPHESLEGDTPWQRFWTDPRALRGAKDDQQLRAMFEIWVKRRVSNDHIVSVGSIHYEMPRGYGGQKVIVRRKLLDATVCFLHNGKVIKLLPVDCNANAHASRAKDNSNDPPRSMSVTTAAEMAFEQDFGPIVDTDGGFNEPSLDNNTPKENNP